MSEFNFFLLFFLNLFDISIMFYEYWRWDMLNGIKNINFISDVFITSNKLKK